MGEETSTNDLIELIHRTVIYGSDKTLNILASMTQYVYNHPEKGEDGKKIDYGSDSENMLSMYIACIISSLKDDFAGYTVDPLTIIQLKISDYDNLKESYKRCLSIIKKDVKNRNS